MTLLREVNVKYSNDAITKSASGALLVNTPSILFDGKTLGADDTNFLWQSAGNDNVPSICVVI